MSIKDTNVSSASPISYRRRMATVIFRTLLPVMLLTVGMAIAFWLMQTKPQAKPRLKVRNATLVKVRTVKFGPQQTVISAMGSVKAAREVELKPQVSGKIIALSGNLIPGGHFRKGETLLKIDPTDYRLAVRQLSSDVAKARSELQLEQGNQLIARKEFELLGEAVSDEEKALMLRQPQLEKVRASIEAAKAKLDQARVDLERTIITAPFNSVVQTRSVNVGTQVSETSVLATLVGTDEYWVEVSVPVSQLRWIRVPKSDSEKGTLVRVYDESAWGEGVYREGRVVRLAAELEKQGRMARLLVSVLDPLNLNPNHADQPRMLINAFVRVEIEGQEVPLAAAIDRKLIRDGRNVWVMDGEGRLDIRPVEIAFKGRDQVLVTGGIGVWERLVVSDISAPVPGMALRLQEEAGATPPTQERLAATADPMKELKR